MPKFIPNNNLVGRADKIGEAKKGQGGTMRGIRNISN